jgi:hypothetical protein
MLVNSTVSLFSCSTSLPLVLDNGYHDWIKLMIDLLLSVEPDNMQARSLRTLIENSVQRDGYIGKLPLRV